VLYSTPLQITSCPASGENTEGQFFAVAIYPGDYGKAADALHTPYAYCRGNRGSQSVSNNQVPVCAMNFRLLASPTVQLGVKYEWLDLALQGCNRGRFIQKVS
jgi:hypothetical protein